MTYTLKKSILCCFLLITAMAMNAQTWPPAGMIGDGLSESTAWEITTPAQLEALALYVNAGNGSQTSGKFYKLMNDIDLSGYSNWIPIGNSSATNYFQGRFDGNDFVVKNLKITGTSNYSGLFGYLLNATIKNLGIVNCNINGGQYTGGLAGYNNATSITNCYVTGNVTANSIVGMV